MVAPNEVNVSRASEVFLYTIAYDGLNYCVYFKLRAARRYSRIFKADLLPSLGRIPG